MNEQELRALASVLDEDESQDRFSGAVAELDRILSARS